MKITVIASEPTDPFASMRQAVEQVVAAVAVEHAKLLRAEMDDYSSRAAAESYIRMFERRVGYKEKHLVNPPDIV